jgi:hypothetical protein
MSRRVVRVARLGAIAALLLPGRAFAADCPPVPKDARAAEALSRAEFDRALELEPSDPREALAHFRCAQRAGDRPAIALQIGTVSERLGDEPGAITSFKHYLELAGADAPDADKMRAHIAELEKRIAERRQAAPPRRFVVWKWLALGAGVATLAAGAALIAIDGPRFDDQRRYLPQQNATLAGGVTLVVASAALLATSTAFFVLDGRKPADTALFVTPGAGGAILGVTHAF